MRKNPTAIKVFVFQKGKENQTKDKRDTLRPGKNILNRSNTVGDMLIGRNK